MEVRDRILIIEDDRSIRKFFRTILEANRYDVIFGGYRRGGLQPDYILVTRKSATLH